MLEDVERDVARRWVRDADLSQGDNRGALVGGDWALNFYKGQCLAGTAVAGVSAYQSASGSIIAGAAHAIRCCGILGN